MPHEGLRSQAGQPYRHLQLRLLLQRPGTVHVLLLGATGGQRSGGGRMPGSAGPGPPAQPRPGHRYQGVCCAHPPASWVQGLQVCREQEVAGPPAITLMPADGLETDMSDMTVSVNSDASYDLDIVRHHDGIYKQIRKVMRNKYQI